MSLAAVRRTTDWVRVVWAAPEAISDVIWARVRSMMKSGGTAPAAKSPCIRAVS